MNFSSINAIYSEHVFLNFEFVENIIIGERKIQNSTLINIHFSTYPFHSESDNSPNLPKS